MVFKFYFKFLVSLVVKMLLRQANIFIKFSLHSTNLQMILLKTFSFQLLCYHISLFMTSKFKCERKKKLLKDAAQIQKRILLPRSSYHLNPFENCQISILEFFKAFSGIKRRILKVRWLFGKGTAYEVWKRRNFRA